MPDRLTRDFAAMHPHEREAHADQVYNEALMAIEAFARREMRRWRFIWVTIGIVAVIMGTVVILNQLNNNRRINADHRIAVQVQALAKQNTAQIQRDREETLLSREQICSLTHRTTTCRDLFDRLARAITQRQRKRLACGVLREFPATSAVVEIRRRIVC